MELNDIGALYDMWYDVWEVDDEGYDEMNYDFNRMLNNIKDEKLDELTKIKENTIKFEEEVVKQFGFKSEHNYQGLMDQLIQLKKTNTTPTRTSNFG